MEQKDILTIKKTYTNKAVNKYLGININYKLLDYHYKTFENVTTTDIPKENQKLVKQIKYSLGCNQIINIDHEQKKITSKYCGYRHCIICNRIRTANYITKYNFENLNLSNPYFITLTIPNVKYEILNKAINHMHQTFNKIRDNYRKKYKGEKLQGIRKFECTYNEKTDTYHPHFHFIQQGLHEAQLLQKYWLKQFPNASIKAQNIKEITTEDDSSLIELFKYATKQITKDSTDAKAEDIIYRALEGMRIYQTYGKLKKIVSPKEAKDEINSADFIPPQEEIWVYDNELKDYTNAKNQPLINTLEIEQKILTSCYTISSS
jgi:hypothetical protein